VFVRAETLINRNFEAARASLAQLAHGCHLTEASAAAYESGLIGELRVGPAGDVRGMSKLVRVYAREPVLRDGTAVLTLRWEATGPGGRLFPALDADLTLTPLDEVSSRLTMDGAYRPPLAALGAGLDRVILNRIANATARSLLTTIAAALSGEPAPGQPAPGQPAPGQPAPGQPAQS
jgi:hypothetical protein